jgi:hypothetical protein
MRGSKTHGLGEVHYIGHSLDLLTGRSKPIHQNGNRPCENLLTFGDILLSHLLLPLLPNGPLIRAVCCAPLHPWIVARRNDRHQVCHCLSRRVAFTCR